MTNVDLRHRHTGRELCSRPVVVCALLVLISALFCGTASAQRDERPPKKKDEAWQKDKYTEDDPTVLRAAAGYVKYAPLAWTPTVTTDRVEQAIGDVKIRWIETAHFRIGSSLQSWKIPGHKKEAKLRLYEELKELKTKLPSVPKKPKSLDPWLRLHLFAQRLENLYADFSELLGVTDESFPKKEGDRPGGKWRGRGPYLGVGGKFNVLLCNKESTCARYLTTFTGADGRNPSRWYFAPPEDYFVFSTAVEFSDGAYEDDTALYCQVVFNIVGNMLDAFCGFVHEPTIWWQEGLQHSFTRRLSDEMSMFTSVEDRSERIFGIKDWDRRTFGLVKNEVARPLSDFAEQFDYTGIKFYDHLCMWSRIEFLRSLGDDKLGHFITRLTECATVQGGPPPKDYVLREQKSAILDLWGYESFDDLDAAWHKWALKEYKNAKRQK